MSILFKFLIKSNSNLLQERGSAYKMTKMLKRYTDDFKYTIVELFNSVKSLVVLIHEYGILRPTYRKMGFKGNLFHHKK